MDLSHRCKPCVCVKQALEALHTSLTTREMKIKTKMQYHRSSTALTIILNPDTNTVDSCIPSPKSRQGPGYILERPSPEDHQGHGQNTPSSSTSTACNNSKARQRKAEWLRKLGVFFPTRNARARHTGNTDESQEQQSTNAYE